MSKIDDVEIDVPISKDVKITDSTVILISNNVINPQIVDTPEKILDSEKIKTAVITRTLIFNSNTFKGLTNGVTPSFLCSYCRRNWTPKLDIGNTFEEPFDFNKQITVEIPKHNCALNTLCPQSGQYISLFLAIHKEKDKSAQVCIQRTDAEGALGIPVDWYDKTEKIIEKVK